MLKGNHLSEEITGLALPESRTDFENSLSNLSNSSNSVPTTGSNQVHDLNKADTFENASFPQHCG